MKITIIAPEPSIDSRRADGIRVVADPSIPIRKGATTHCQSPRAGISDKEIAAVAPEPSIDSRRADGVRVVAKKAYRIRNRTAPANRKVSHTGISDKELSTIGPETSVHCHRASRARVVADIAILIKNGAAADCQTPRAGISYKEIDTVAQRPPVTLTELVEAALLPIQPFTSATVPPLTVRLPVPLLPTVRSPLLVQRPPLTLAVPSDPV